MRRVALCSTPYGVIAVITTRQRAANGPMLRCSTPYGVIAVITGRNGLEPYPILCSTPYGVIAVITCDKAEANLHTESCSTPYGVIAVITQVQRAVRSVTWSAQRRMASLRSSRQRCRWARTKGWCSTPYGVIAVITAQSRPGRRLRCECSTPYGVIAVITTRRDRTNGVVSHGAQRRMASLRSSPPARFAFPRRSSRVLNAVWRHCGHHTSDCATQAAACCVLNAVWRHCGHHADFEVVTASEAVCAQRRMASLRSSQFLNEGIRHAPACSTPYGVIAVITSPPDKLIPLTAGAQRRMASLRSSRAVLESDFSRAWRAQRRVIPSKETEPVSSGKAEPLGPAGVRWRAQCVRMAQLGTRVKARSEVGQE